MHGMDESRLGRPATEGGARARMRAIPIRAWTLGRSQPWKSTGAFVQADIKGKEARDLGYGCSKVK